MEARNWENNFENVGFVVLFFSSGLTIPAEIIVLKASSTEISKSLTEDSGTSVYQPVVGFGAVGIKILSSFSSKSGCKEGPTLPVTKPNDWLVYLGSWVFCKGFGYLCWRCF